MLSVSPGSPNSTRLIGEDALPHAGSPAAHQGSRAKRWLVAGVRRLHEEPFIFPLMVNVFRALQYLGISVTPNHFYWPVPDVAELGKRDWCKYPLPPGVSLHEQAQLGRELAGFAAECDFSSGPCGDAYHYNNGYFESVDAEVAYGLVRRSKPIHIVEIGTGYSTRVLAAALERNAAWDRVEGKLVSIDPSPERLPGADWGDRLEQVPCAVQDVDLEFFDVLTRGDILFIDSSHVVATGSDVTREYLQILPRLRPGVLVHIHDIFLPFDYPRDAVLNRLWFWSEQYLLQAFLSFNREFEVLWAASAMQAYHPMALEQCFPHWRHSYRDMPESKRRFVPTADGDRIWPSSFWMRRV
jgi:predicted O-methyltransferase YrrM